MDEVRIRVLLNFLRTIHAEKMGFVAPRYVWFPEPKLNHYELRMGNAPSDSDRPRWLKGMKLEIDPSNVSQWVRDLVVQGGYMDQQMEAKLEELQLEPNDAQINIIRQHVISTVAKQLFNKRDRIYA